MKKSAKQLKYIFLVIFQLLLFSSFTSGNLLLHSNVFFNFDTVPRLETSWKYTGNGGKISSDSKDFVEGKSSWCIKFESFEREKYTIIFNGLELPEVSDEIGISLYCKSTVADKSWLKIMCLDVNENLVKKDSVNINAGKEWSNFVLKVNAPKTKMVYVEIGSISNDVSSGNSKIVQKLWLDSLNITTEKANQKFVKTRKLDRSNSISNKYVKLKSLNDLYSCKDFKDHKIIAFGETVHGSDEIQYYTFEVIKYLIEHRNCRLVLFELPFELGLRLNDFVLGESSDNIENLMIQYNYNIDRFTNTLNWIKKYNSGTNEKVAISGIDTNISNPFGNSNLQAFIKNQNLKGDSIDLFGELIKKERYNEALLYLSEREALFNDIPKNKLEAIRHAIKLRLGIYSLKSTLLEDEREYLQFQNAKFSIDNWLNDSTNAFLYTHLGHVNKVNNLAGRIYVPNFGNYMHKYYNDDYFVVAILVGEGTIINNNYLTGKFSNFQLIKPIKGSLEETFLGSKNQISYTNLDVNSLCGYIRIIGQAYATNQFYFCSYTKRFDACFFIKSSQGYSFHTSWAKPN